MKQKTAIDWLLEQIGEYIEYPFNPHKDKHEIISEAKAKFR